MLDLLAFDLDGTLADTERLKAESYAWAAHQLRPEVEHAEVEAAYGGCVGLSREEIARSLLHRFGLEAAAQARDGSVEPWASYVTLRLERYRAMLADGALVRRHARPAGEVVRQAHHWARSVALVTTSDAHNAGLVLGALGLADAFDTVVTSDDVAQTKPDPEGYRLALARLGADAGRSLAVEDSPAGVRAALAAGMAVLAVPDGLTRDGIQALVDDRALPPASVLAPAALADAVRRAAELV